MNARKEAMQLIYDEMDKAEYGDEDVRRHHAKHIVKLASYEDVMRLRTKRSFRIETISKFCQHIKAVREELLKSVQTYLLNETACVLTDQILMNRFSSVRKNPGDLNVIHESFSKRWMKDLPPRTCFTEPLERHHTIMEMNDINERKKYMTLSLDEILKRRNEEKRKKMIELLLKGDRIRDVTHCYKLLKDKTYLEKELISSSKKLMASASVFKPKAAVLKPAAVFKPATRNVTQQQKHQKPKPKREGPPAAVCMCCNGKPDECSNHDCILFCGGQCMQCMDYPGMQH